MFLKLLMSFKINLNPLQIYLYKRPQTIYYALFLFAKRSEESTCTFMQMKSFKEIFPKILLWRGGGGLKVKKNQYRPLTEHFIYIYIKFIYLKLNFDIPLT